jgi:hypothetical protein
MFGDEFKSQHHPDMFFRVENELRKSCSGGRRKAWCCRQNVSFQLPAA